MTLTPAERAEISRENGKKSRGPVTPEGKEASRRNAVKHGLRAEVLALPNEDPEAVAAREQSWNDYYRPRSPAAQHLVTQCVQATLLADRVHRAHGAALSKQVREAEAECDHTAADRVAALKKLLISDPAEAVRLLKRFEEGCSYLIGRWEYLDGQLTGRGHWSGPDRDEAIRLLGLDPDPKKIRDCPGAWLTRLYNLVCRKNPREGAIEWMFHRDHFPDAFAGTYRADFYPDADNCRRLLREMIAEQVGPLNEDEERLAVEHGDPDRAEAADRASILRDAPSARLFLRYHAEARLAFHKAYAGLVKELERDGAGHDEPVTAPAAPAPAASPNEPSPPAAVDPATPAPPNEPGTPLDPPPAAAQPVSPNEPGTEPCDAVSEPAAADPGRPAGRQPALPAAA